MPKTQTKIPTATKLRTSCDACTAAKTRCSKEQPQCLRCVKHGHQCVYGRSRRKGKPPMVAKKVISQASEDDQLTLRPWSGSASAVNLPSGWSKERRWHLADMFPEIDYNVSCGSSWDAIVSSSSWAEMTARGTETDLQTGLTPATFLIEALECDGQVFPDNSDPLVYSPPGSWQSLTASQGTAMDRQTKEKGPRDKWEWNDYPGDIEMGLGQECLEAYHGSFTEDTC
ncbi:hypothetical protein BJY04DRAFT_64952 [Aspergillus karnatakaensis]|uniref:Zn(II)2Cys6 transcription factor domain-containing protein n=1 Tax=Aspergillus karnatakaensis TaxID=1810916 RepID=UPI003CCCB4FD